MELLPRKQKPSRSAASLLITFALISTSFCVYLAFSKTVFAKVGLVVEETNERARITNVVSLGGRARGNW